MRKRLIFIFVSLVVIVIGLVLLRTHETDPHPSLIVAFAGPVTDASYRAAGFSITNKGERPIYLADVELHVSKGAGYWGGPSDGRELSWTIRQPGKTNSNVSRVLEPGQSRTIVVEWPNEAPWRLQLTYGLEAKGAVERIWLAVRHRKRPKDQDRVFAGFRKMLTEEVRE